jgi:hypothetical protein
MKLHTIVVVVLAVLGAASLVVYLTHDGEGTPDDRKVVLVKGGRGEIKDAGGKNRPAKVSIKERRKIKIKPVPANRVKPGFDIPDEEEAKLNAEQKKLIAEIRAALDRDDEKKLCALVQKMQASDEWPDGIPRKIRLTAIEALGWFGASCLPEIAGFLVDGDEEILQVAIGKYEEALGDFDLSDRERSEILIMAAKSINDADALDAMLFELNNMRHSVAVSTIKTLMGIQNEALRSVLPDNIEFYTGEDNMNSAGALDRWLAENPDDEMDEEFYGGIKSEEKN